MLVVDAVLIAAAAASTDIGVRRAAMAPAPSPWGYHPPRRSLLPAHLLVVVVAEKMGMLEWDMSGRLRWRWHVTVW